MAVADNITPLTPIMIDTDEGVNFPGLDCVISLSIAQNTAESVTVPGATSKKARYVRIATDVNLLINTNATAVVNVDNAVGTAAELLPSAVGERWYYLGAVTTISVITMVAAGGNVTFSFYRD
jgi:hypothetical protein